MIVVSNTSPINYLILIGQIDLLPKLFRQITIPQAVYSELFDKEAPKLVRTWIATPPDWLKIQPTSQDSDAIIDLLDYPLSSGTQCRFTSARRYESAKCC